MAHSTTPTSPVAANSGARGPLTISAPTASIVVVLDPSKASVSLLKISAHTDHTYFRWSSVHPDGTAAGGGGTAATVQAAPRGRSKGEVMCRPDLGSCRTFGFGLRDGREAGLEDDDAGDVYERGLGPWSLSKGHPPGLMKGPDPAKCRTFGFVLRVAPGAGLENDDAGDVHVRGSG